MVSRNTSRRVLTFSGAGETPFVYHLNNEYSAGPATEGSIVIIKRPLPLDSSVPLQKQVQAITLPGPPNRTGQDTGTPYEILYALMRWVISPYFDSCTRGENEQSVRRGKGLDDAKTGLQIRLLLD